MQSRSYSGLHTLRYEMLLAALYVLVVLGAGLGALQALGLLNRGGAALGLAPALGLAVLTICATWSVAARLPPPLPGFILLALAGLGAGSTARDFWRALRCHYRSAGWLVVSVVVPLVVMGVAFHGVEAPLSTHDGAFHVEVIDSLRRGQPLRTWYPPGLEANFAALLQLTPWQDSAAGAFELALGLTILAPLTVFGLASAVRRDTTVAGVAALFVSLTYLFGYFVHIWSGWPLQASILMLLGAWILAYEYVRVATPFRVSVAGGVLGGAIVVTHGSELLSAALIVPVVLIASWRRIIFARLLRDVGVVAMVAVACALPYVPTLTQWTSAGGATTVGYTEAAAIDVAAQTAAGGEPLRVFALDTLGIDLPVRVVLALIGGWWIFRKKTGRALVVVGLTFAAIATAFSFFSVAPGVRLVYALTYPWGLPYRLFQVDAAAIAIMAAAGGVWVARLVGQRGANPRLVRAARVCVGFWLVVATVALTLFVSIPTAEVTSFSEDDAAAMAWLRANVPPATVVVNDGYADAGIWIPYKAGLQIVLPRILPDADFKATRERVVENVARLDTVRETACGLQVGYVYYGAKSTGWQARSFPPLAELRASQALVEVFSQGDAVLFRTRLLC